MLYEGTPGIDWPFCPGSQVSPVEVEQLDKSCLLVESDSLLFNASMSVVTMNTSGTAPRN